jgi:hypothetical protein
MTEPTIDEMLDWLSRVQVPVGKPQPNMLEAIRAILEHQRLVESPVEKIQLAAVRAFVERVRKRYRDEGTLQGLTSMLDELAAIEKDNEANNG